MSKYLVSSREGLFLFDSCEGSYRMLKEGKYFGLCSYKDLWYVVGFRSDRYLPTDTGYIESFKLVDGEIKDVHLRASGLDNGCHQMIVYGNLLYVLETYHQRVKVFEISDSEELILKHVFYPSRRDDGRVIVNARYVLSGLIKDAVCDGYLHMNAITIHDDLIYISCPRLRNAISEDLQPSHKQMNHLIKVFDLDFNPLWDFEIPGEFYCHDLVFIGHKLYMTSPPDKVIEFCILTKSHKIFHRFPGCNLPRGLSITHDRRILVGSRDINGAMMLKQGVTKRWITPFAPCCIMNLEKDADFNNCNTPFNRSFVLQLDAREVFRNDIAEFDQLQSIVERVLNQESIVRMGRGVDSYRKKYTADVYTLDDIITPSDETFTDICAYQSTEKQKVPYGD